MIKLNLKKGTGELTLIPLDFNTFELDEDEKKVIIKDKITEYMFKSVRKVSNALRYGIIQRECQRRVEASTEKNHSAQLNYLPLRI